MKKSVILRRPDSLTRAVRVLYFEDESFHDDSHLRNVAARRQARFGDRKHNAFGTERMPANPRLESYEREIMKQEPLILNDEARLCVEEAMRGVATFRTWNLHSINVRTNHVHLFITTTDEVSSDKVMNDMKARATLCLRQQKLVTQDRIIWVRGGSKKVVKGELSAERIAFYIEKCQNRPS